ncbi:uncharacterized protein SAPINGB_P004485 [Magnusiomyces paraingens]|uniref:Uncharacterized protein n=1 Tax=Magnusiomyces paraingens TaxID=2606893 RepID=A0A5E8BUP8_9ASCO|nr:uncharacterized protein SAPINGB_P004485 [Saprochaete ingens]VVT55216.1 unnamed protein product [Saprochaete ingens]
MVSLAAASFSIPEISLTLFFHPVVLVIVFLLFVTILFIFRSRWLPIFSSLPWYRSSAAASRSSLNEASSFLDDYRAGLSSSNFDLSANIDGDDSRQGLDTEARAAIVRAMNTDPSLSFDEARRKYFVQKLKENNIGPDGLPNDPKALVFHRN